MEGHGKLEQMGKLFVTHSQLIRANDFESFVAQRCVLILSLMLYCLEAVRHGCDTGKCILCDVGGDLGLGCSASMV